MSLAHGGPEHKAAIRAKVWKQLRAVALPDSRFHFDFASFIADFEGSQAAADALLALPAYRACSTVFIAPDNCLEYLRECTLAAGINVLTTSYGIRRGFWLLDSAQIAPRDYRLASTLDGMEKVARQVTLRDILNLQLCVGLMVTGTGAINNCGIRFGKGHGFFDLEWGLLYAMNVVHADTITAALVHDCQVLDEELIAEEFDTVCDLVVTPTRILKADVVKKPTCGILWHKLAPGMLTSIPPLQELRALQVVLCT